MAYLVQEEDGTSLLELEESGGFLLLEESGAAVALVGADGYGVSASVFSETSRGVVGAAGSGVVVFSGVTKEKAGRGVVGANAASRSASFAQPEGVSIGFGQSLLTPYPEWTRIDA